MKSFMYDRTWRLAALVCLVCALGLVGCSRQATTPDADTTTKPAVKPAPASLPAMKKPDKTEIMDKGSGVYSRTLVYGGITGDTVVEARMVYESGDKGTLYYDELSGKLKETVETYANGKVKAQAKFAADGKLIAGKYFDRDGKPLFGAERDATGKLRYDRYWLDGSYVFIADTTDSAGNGSRTVYRPGGKIPWALVTLAAPDTRVTQSPVGGTVPLVPRIVHTVFMDDSGKPSRKIIYGQQGFEVIWYGADGKTPVCKQYWNLQRSSINMPGALTKVEEYEADGVTIKRRLHMSGNTGPCEVPVKAELFSGGKAVSVRYYETGTPKEDEFELVEKLESADRPEFSEDHTCAQRLVLREEFLADDGKVKETKNYAAADAVKEALVISNLRQPRFPLLDKMSREIGFGERFVGEGMGTVKGDVCRQWYLDLIGGVR